MTEKEAAAIAFLARAANPASGYTPAMIEHSQTILAMLAAPRLPKEPTNELLIAGDLSPSNYVNLYAHLTPKPKIKMIRIRAKGVDMLVEPPVSQSEVEVDQ